MFVWSDYSPDAVEMKRRLRAAGHVFTEILTGDSTPTISDEGFYSFGYQRIYTQYGLQDVRK